MMKSMLMAITITTSVVMSPFGIDTSIPMGDAKGSDVRALSVEEVCAGGDCSYQLPFMKCCQADNTWKMHTWCQAGSGCNIGDDCPGMEEN